MKEAGYVYILTNPSFKEDWVKIGKSSRPVDIRSKELDNTAVPLPFEIYATLKTVKYEQVEKLIHKTIDRLTDLRIRQNREFFNVSPAKALEILKDISTTLDDAEINEFHKKDEIGSASFMLSGKKGDDVVFSENIAVRESIIEYIEKLINNQQVLSSKLIVRHFQKYSTISYEKNYLWFVRVYYNRTWDNAYISFPNPITGSGEINKSKINKREDVSNYINDLNTAIEYIIKTYC